MKNIFFHNEVPINYRLLNKQLLRNWLHKAAKKEGYQIKNLNFIFCTDEYLYEMNINYLQHDTYTDVITFDQSEEKSKIEGDIFISLERVKENAIQNKSKIHNELHRIMIHGLLHLMNYKDKSAALKKKMTAKEEEYLKLRPKVCC